MNLGYSCSSCECAIPAKDRKPRLLHPCPTCGKARPAGYLLEQGVAVFGCERCITSWGVSELEGQEVVFAPESLAKLEEPPDRSRVDAELVAALAKRFEGRVLSWGQAGIRCVEKGCKRYLKIRHLRTGTCDECRQPLRAERVSRTCTEPDCKLVGQNQSAFEDYFCSHCKGRLKLERTGSYPSSEEWELRSWANRMAEEGRLRVVKAGAPLVDEPVAPPAPVPEPKPETVTMLVQELHAPAAGPVEPVPTGKAAEEVSLG